MTGKEYTPDCREVEVISGNQEILENGAYPHPLVPFDEKICAMLSAVSNVLMNSSQAKAYPEIITFGFFCRKSNLSNLAMRWSNSSAGRLGCGVSFHIAPSNVPINFAYSLVAGLLAGNACVVKASSKDFEQVRLICKAFNQVLAMQEHAQLAPYVQVIMYERERQDLTEWFSSQCNVRVIWGGDETIARIREAPLPPRARELCFADRYSFGLLNAEKIIRIAGQNDDIQLQQLAQNFFNDTYLFDQNACSSQRLVIWHGNKDDCEKARTIFWKTLHNLLVNSYAIESVIAVDKLTATFRTALELEKASVMRDSDNLISRVEIKSLDDRLPSLRAPGGFFHEYVATQPFPEGFASLCNIVNEKYQTLSYFGEDPEELQNLIISYGLKGIDRVVPIGKSANFDLIWDGYDLICEMSRIVDCA